MRVECPGEQRPVEVTVAVLRSHCVDNASTSARGTGDGLLRVADDQQQIDDDQPRVDDELELTSAHTTQDSKRHQLQCGVWCM